MMEEMTLEYAKELLGVGTINSVELLQSQYRKLLKRYHPDKYQNNIKFYTVMTSRITQAYQLISDNIPPSQSTVKKYPPSSSKTYHKSNRANHSDDTHSAKYHTAYKQDHTADRLRGTHRDYALQINHEYHQHINIMIESICHYYSYNLSNVYLRDSGTTRTHFNTIRNKLSKMIAKFCQQIERNGDYQQDVYVYYLFCKSFFDHTQSELRINRQLNKIGYKLLNIYRNYTKELDVAIETYYCNSENNKHQPSSDNLLVIRRNFKQLSEENPLFGFHEVATVKQRLADTFLHTLCWEYYT